MEKFILLGFPRTGTTVLAGSLIAHQDILFYGEIFSNTPEVRVNEANRITLGAGWKIGDSPSWQIPVLDYQQSSKAYLDQFFEREIPYKALGFKLMMDQVQECPNSDVWSYLAEHRDIKIIQTRRTNLIEILCSFVRANMTRRWHTSGEAIPNQNRFVVPPQECLKLFQRFETSHPDITHIGETHQVLELDYQAINENFSGCLTKMSEFLGVNAFATSEPKLKKIASLKPNEELANYAELKDYFKGSRYEQYFIY